MRSSPVARAAPGAGCPAAAAAQDALTGVGPGTEVSKIEFRFAGEHALEEKDLRPHIALTARGGNVGIRRALSFIPFITDVGTHPFRPIELQRDVVRLRNVYTRNGWLNAEGGLRRRVPRQGRPGRHRLRDRGGTADSCCARCVSPARTAGPPRSTPELTRTWGRFRRRSRTSTGRFGEGERRDIADRTARWLRDRGYPFAAVEADALVDTAAYRADVVVRVQPGLRARIREFAVSGNETVPARHFTRQMPLEPGDWYNASELEQGRAAAHPAPHREARADQRAPGERRRLQRRRAPGRDGESARLVRGEAGLVSTGGLTSQVEWSHRSFLGGARTFTVAADRADRSGGARDARRAALSAGRVRVPALCGLASPLRGRWAVRGIPRRPAGSLPGGRLRGHARLRDRSSALHLPRLQPLASRGPRLRLRRRPGADRLSPASRARGLGLGRIVRAASSTGAP